MLMPNGDVYQGYLRNGKKNGRGLIIFAKDRKSLDGYWQNDRFLSKAAWWFLFITLHQLMNHPIIIINHEEIILRIQRKGLDWRGMAWGMSSLKQVAKQMKNSPFTRLRYTRMIAEAEQYHVYESVNLQGSAASVWLQEFFSSSPFWSSQSSESSQVFEDLACLLGFLTQFTGTWTASGSRWRWNAVRISWYSKNCLSQTNCGASRASQDHHLIIIQSQ